MTAEQRPPPLLRYWPVIATVIGVLVPTAIAGFAAVNSLSHKLAAVELQQIALKAQLEAEQLVIKNAIAELKVERAQDRQIVTDMRVAFARVETRIQQLLDELRNERRRGDVQ